MLEQSRGAGVGRLTGRFGVSRAAGEAPGVAVGGLQRQAALADTRRAGNQPQAGGTVEMLGQAHQFRAAPEEAAPVGGGQVAARAGVAHQRFAARQAAEAQAGLAEEGHFVRGDVALRPFHGLAEGVAVGQVGVQGAGESNGLLVAHRQRVADHGAGQALREQGLSGGAGLGGGLAGVEHHQVEGVRQAQALQQFGDGHGVEAAKGVLQQQALLPGVAAEVQHVGEETLFRQAG